MILEAIGYSADLTTFAYLRLKSVAASLMNERQEGSNNYIETRSIFLDAWSIVDHAHMLRMLLQRAGDFIEDAALTDAIRELASATKCRNHMDHLHEKIDNLSKRKGPVLPLYGSVSFARIVEADQDGIKGVDLIVMSSGTHHHVKSRLSVVNPLGREIEHPVGCFQLEAFDHRVDLSGVAQRSNVVRSLFNTAIADEIRGQIESSARAAGHDVAAALEPNAAEVIAVMRMTRNTPNLGGRPRSEGGA